MTSNNTIKGEALENWLADVIKPYLGENDSIDVTKTHERYDVNLTFSGKLYLLECKCFSLLQNGTLGQIALKRKQMSALKNRPSAWFTEKEVLYIGGILLNDYEVYCVVIPLQKALDKMKETNGKNFVHWTMSQSLKEMPLRTWLSNILGVEQQDIEFPEFRLYLDYNEE